CNRAESDEALKFCRVDGTALVADSGSVSADAGTVTFGSAESSEIATSILPHLTESNINRATAPTTVLPPQSAGSPTQKFAKSNRAKPLLAIGAVLMIVSVVGGFFYLRGKRERTIESVAVLPFENRSGSADSEYLSDGLAESLIY